MLVTSTLIGSFLSSVTTYTSPTGLRPKSCDQYKLCRYGAGSDESNSHGLNSDQKPASQQVAREREREREAAILSCCKSYRQVFGLSSDAVSLCTGLVVAMTVASTA